MEKNNHLIILGAGVTGLAAGTISGAMVFEAEDRPGGICASYYRNGYRFEKGGGHWIFGGNSAVQTFIRKFSPTLDYKRNSAIYFAGNLPVTEKYKGKFVPFPIQNNLWFFKEPLRKKILTEMVNSRKQSFETIETMAEWLKVQFGPTLYDLFFAPFNKVYTADLFTVIAPQDTYKSPVNLTDIEKGYFGKPADVGYNVTFIYPKVGLDYLVEKMVSQTQLRLEKEAIRIDPKTKIIYFSDGSEIHYESLLSTLPLNIMMEMTGINCEEPPDPYTSVLVINIGAEVGNSENARHGYHWLYIPDSKTGFHRVGYYSNVGKSFLPQDKRDPQKWCSLYIEKSYPSHIKLPHKEVELVSAQTIEELRQWGFIDKVDIVDPTWVDVAYTWTKPRNSWREKSIKLLEKYDIHQIGRYARWSFQGIADSIREGLNAGSRLKR